MNKKLVLAFAVLALSALACGFDFNTGGADEDSNVLFQDDFSSTSSLRYVLSNSNLGTRAT